MRICRTLGTSKLRNLDPFLMLDELRMPAKEASAGFPDHPHRGFETCSIMFSGKMEHHDSVGNQVLQFSLIALQPAAWLSLWQPTYLHRDHLGPDLACYVTCM